MELKELLGEELFNQVTKKLEGSEMQVTLHKTAEKILVDDGTFIKKDDKNFVPYDRFKAINEAKKELENQVAKLSTDVIALQKDATENPVLKQKLANIETELKTNKEQLAQKEIDLKKDFAIQKLLLKNGALYPELLTQKIDKSKIELDSADEVKDGENVVKPLKDQFKVMFGKPSLTGRSPDGHDNDGIPFEGLITKEQFMAMPEADRIKKADKINESSVHWQKQKT